MNDTKFIGREKRPRDHFAFLNLVGVKKHLPKDINAYAVMVGTPAALTKDVNATGEGRMVRRSTAATVCMTITAFRGSFFSDTVEIHPEKGRTPSRATAQMSREAATPATDVFRTSPTMQMMFMNMWPPLPMDKAYSWTNGCGEVMLLMMSKPGRQKRNRKRKSKKSIMAGMANLKR